MAETRRFAGVAGRRQLRSLNNLGVINPSINNVSEVLTGATQNSTQQLRKPELDIFDSYFEKRQYAGRPDWTDSTTADGSYIPIRKRKPLLQSNFAKVLSSRLASKLIGSRTFPIIKIEEDPNTTELLRTIHKVSQFRSNLLFPMARKLNTGSVYVNFSIRAGTYQMGHFLSKWCFPEFDEGGNLSFIRIQYVFSDEADRDENGMPKKKWFRMDQSTSTDVLFNNPEFQKGSVPEFQVVESVQHDLGFVQGEWLITHKAPNSIDGPSLISDVLEFIDELNFSISQSADTVQYNQDPQLLFTNIDEDEVDELIRSSAKAWNLGREGKAELLEANMSGFEGADTLRDKMRLNIQDITRIILMDPEKMVAQAQSGKALEILHGPLVELVEELRPQTEKEVSNLTLKMLLATLIWNQRGLPTPVVIPPGFVPASVELTFDWPSIFPMTFEDMQKKLALAIQASNASILSRETALGFVSKMFGVEDIEEEQRKIDAQPVINPFGAF